MIVHFVIASFVIHITSCQLSECGSHQCFDDYDCAFEVEENLVYCDQLRNVCCQKTDPPLPPPEFDPAGHGDIPLWRLEDNTIGLPAEHGPAPVPVPWIPSTVQGQPVLFPQQAPGSCGEYPNLVYPDPGSGPKSLSSIRFYYDSALHRCLAFTYFGQAGNANNYETLDACNQKCVFAIADKVVCPGSNIGCVVGETGMCKLGEYCLATPPAFTSGMCCDQAAQDMLEMAIQGRCGPGYRVGEDELITRSCDLLTCPINQECIQINKQFGICCYPAPGAGDPDLVVSSCGEKNPTLIYPDPGYGTVETTRYYYDEAIHRCLAFTYKGLGGNSNNHKSFDECMDNCVTVIPDLVRCEGSNRNCRIEEDGSCPSGEFCKALPPFGTFGMCCDQLASDMLADAIRGRCFDSDADFGSGDGKRIARTCSTLVCNDNQSEACNQINPQFAICCPIPRY